jgi:hypothetical protein
MVLAGMTSKNELSVHSGISRERDAALEIPQRIS